MSTAVHPVGPCAQCKSPVSNTAWHRMDGQWYCDGCYGGAFSPAQPTTLRDQIAMRALQPLIAHALGHDYQYAEVAERAYRFADAVLKERCK